MAYQITWHSTEIQKTLLALRSLCCLCACVLLCCCSIRCNAIAFILASPLLYLLYFVKALLCKRFSVFAHAIASCLCVEIRIKMYVCIQLVYFKRIF